MTKEMAILILWLAVLGEMNCSWGHQSAAEDMKHTASDAMHDAKEKTDSWANWAKEKFTEGFGVNQKDAAQKTMDKAQDAAAKTKDNINDAAHEASKKAGDAAEMASEKAKKFTSDKANDAKETISDAMEHGKDKAQHIYTDAKEHLESDSVQHGKGKAWNVYTDGKENLESAKDTMTGKAKANYEDAKDKASNTMDDLKHKMTKDDTEL